MYKNNHYGCIVQSLKVSLGKRADSLAAYVTNYRVWEEHWRIFFILYDAMCFNNSAGSNTPAAVSLKRAVNGEGDYPIMCHGDVMHPEGTSNIPDNFQEYQKILIGFCNGVYDKIYLGA